MAVATVPRGSAFLQTSIGAGIPVDLIDTADNVRADLGDVTELAESIEQHGVLQPVQVRAKGDRYLLIFGHRRLAAAKQAGLVEIPAIVTDPPAGARTITQLVENLQREDLNPLEEARALKAILAADKKLTQAELAKRIGRSAPFVSNALRILDTQPEVQQLIAEGMLSGSHGKALAGLPKNQQAQWAQAAAERGYSAHEVEERIANDREWQQRRAAEARETAKTRDERVAKALEKLPDKAARIVVQRDYNQQGEAIANRLTKAGYTHVELGHPRARKDTLDCDCGVTGIDVGFNGGLSIFPGCIEQKHRDAKWAVERTENEQAREREQRIRDNIAEHLRVAISTLDPLAARVVLWAVMDWSLNDWVKEHKGDRKKPNAWEELVELEQPALAAEVAKFAAERFGDRYGVRLDWPAIAEAFGVPADQPTTPPAKPKKGAK